jgi:hypothetical protein
MLADITYRTSGHSRITQCVHGLYLKQLVEYKGKLNGNVFNFQVILLVFISDLYLQDIKHLLLNCTCYELGGSSIMLKSYMINTNIMLCVILHVRFCHVLPIVTERSHY